MARPMNLRGLILSFLAGAVIAAVVFWFWRGPAVPSPEAAAALKDWLAVECKVNEGSEHDDALRKFRGELETPLINLFKLGPAKSEIQQVESDARRQFERTKYLISSGYSRLPASDVDALRTTSAEAWAERAGKEFADSQKSAALTGLGITGGTEGRRLLEQVADDPKSPFNDVARLARFGEPPDKPAGQTPVTPTSVKPTTVTPAGQTPAPPAGQTPPAPTGQTPPAPTGTQDGPRSGGQRPAAGQPPTGEPPAKDYSKGR